MTALDNIALANKRLKDVESWHRKLAKQIPASAVYNLFLDCKEYENYIIFNDRDKFNKAQDTFTHEFKQVFPDREMRMFNASDYSSSKS